jgi:hypothetical protein
MTGDASTRADHEPAASPIEQSLWQPNIARFWNFAGGGKDNLARDRAVISRAERGFPLLGEMARANHQFLLRATAYLATEQRITQFLVLGPGIPADDNLHFHDTVRAFNPIAKVLYVDNDPIVLAHARHGGGSHRNTYVVDGDIFDAKQLLERAEVSTFLNWSVPIGIICTAVLHYHPGETADVAAIMQTYIKAAAVGSCTAISHFLDPGVDDFDVRRLEQLLNTGLGLPVRFRTLAEIKELFPDQDLLAPGAVPCRYWPDPEADAPATFPCIAGGIGQKLDRQH